MRSVVAVLVLLCGCDAVWGFDQGVCYGRNGDGGGGLLQVCTNEIPAWTHPASINTSGADCDRVVRQSDVDMSEACVIFADAIVIDGALEIRGGRPLVLVAVTDLTVAVDIRLSAKHGPAAMPDSLAGPGGNGAGCVSTTIQGKASTKGGGGGAGASFGGEGGAGGSAFANPSGGGVAEQIAPLGVVRGGCGGGRGGSGNGAGGQGGAGGGALYLIAGRSITIAAGIDASGAGGIGGGDSTSGAGGGGGGGSGGLIGFDAPEIVIERGARVVANGGGGGGGGGVTSGANGKDGEDPDPASPASTVAAGGFGGTAAAGSGGNGAAGALPAVAGENTLVMVPGGGGGGGGAGHIKLFAQTITDDGGAFSPPYESR
ncbi:MAG: hypothetical protein IPQ07_22460 [Myxococcales bacterium]|nr:hypothetical protein [Myxococcales bacterium]